MNNFLKNYRKYHWILDLIVGSVALVYFLAMLLMRTDVIISIAGLILTILILRDGIKGWYDYE